MKTPPSNPRYLLVTPMVITTIGVAFLVSFGVLLSLYFTTLRFDQQLAYTMLGGIVGGGVALIGLLACGWGYVAISLRHPACDQDYADWLRSTPWAPGLPLPRGPVRLSLPHFLGCSCLSVVALLVGLTSPLTPSWHAVIPLPAMLAGASLALLHANWLTRQRWCVYSTIVAVLACLLLPPMYALSVAPLAAYGIGLLGVKAALREFPWLTPTPSAPPLGWPYAALLSEPSEMRVETWEAALRGSLVCCGILIVFGWLLPPVTNPDDDPAIAAQMFGGLGCLMLAALRLGSYGPAVCPVLCWGHRVGAGRWIVPKHDQIFAIGGAIVVAGCLLPLLLNAIGFPRYLSTGIGVGLAVFIAYGVGPSVVEQFYTGPHAIMPSYGSLDKRKQTFVEVNS